MINLGFVADIYHFCAPPVTGDHTVTRLNIINYREIFSSSLKVTQNVFFSQKGQLYDHGIILHSIMIQKFYYYCLGYY